ncbi:GNAT family N-acetyltransferase, partial [Streptomyces dangxiongensis]
MTGQACGGSASIALAVRGDGHAAAALGALALGSHLDSAAVPAVLAAAIDEHGGCVPLPYGQGQCRIARVGETIAGMLYATPPIRWLRAHPPAQRNGLIHSLTEIELLAVAEPYRHHGIGTALLEETEHAARADGTRLALAKVRIGAFPVMRWYRRRGYTVAAQGEPVVFRTRLGGLTSCDDGSDGYQLAVKALQ